MGKVNDFPFVRKNAGREAATTENRPLNEESSVEWKKKFLISIYLRHTS